MHDRRRVATPALPDLQPATELADTAPPRAVVQGHRAPRPAPRGRRTPQNQPQAQPRLGRPSTARRTHPTHARGAARTSPGHPGHGAAIAPPSRPCPADLDRGLRAQLTAGCVVDRAEYARYEARPPPCRRPPGSRSPSTKIRGTRPSPPPATGPATSRCVARGDLVTCARQVAWAVRGRAM